MKKIALTAVAIAALSLGACQGPNKSGNASGNASANTSANASHNASGEAGHNTSGDGHSNASTVINNGLEGAGNLAAKTGDVLENTGRAALNEVKDAGKAIGNATDGR